MADTPPLPPELPDAGRAGGPPVPRQTVPADDADGVGAGARVEQHVALGATPEHVWRTLTDPTELASWLGAEVVLDVAPGEVGHVVDDEGAVRQVLVTAVEPGRRLAWHWWEDGGELSTVEITTRPDGDGTLVTVVETLAAPVPSGGPRASASAAAGCAGAAGAGHRWEVALVRVGFAVVASTALPAGVAAGT